MKIYLSELIKRKDLLGYLVTSGLKAQHRNSFLGYIWWMLDPLLGMLVYYFLVVVILRRGGEGYGSYLIVGLVVFRSISSTLNMSAKSITSQSGIISQVYLPKALFPLGTSLSQLINFFFGLIIVAVFLVILRVVPGVNILWLPLVLFFHFLFISALSLIIGYICVFFRDIENLLSPLNTLLRYGSPVIWEVDMLPERFNWIYQFNPLTVFLNGYRNIILYNAPPDFSQLFLVGFGSMLIVLLMMNHYSKHEHKIIKVL